MPYLIQDNGEDAGDRRYCVYKHDADNKPIGDPLGCHPSEEKAKAQMAALYANEGKAIKADGPDSDYLIVDEDGIQRLRVKVNGAPDHRLMGAAWAALHEGYRGNRYEGPDKGKAIAKLEKLYEAEGMSAPGKSVFLKARGPDVSVVAGWGVVFGGKDLSGETFTPETDFMPGLIPEPWVFYDHTMQNVKHALGKAKVEAKRDGLWVEAQIDMHKEYAEEILELVEDGVLGWSSGSVGHLVQREGKTIKRWPIADFSLTPTPCEPRTLGVEVVKSLFNEAGIPVPEALAEASEDAPARDEEPPVAETKTQEIQMDEKVESTAAPDIGALVEAAVAKVFEKRAAEPLKEGGVAIAAPAVKRVTELGFADDEMKSFVHFLKTGDDVPYKAAMQGQTDDEGGYAVPDDFYNQVVAKRDELSVARRAGAQVVQTQLDRVLVPIEGTSMAAFAITSEEGAVDEDEPTLGQVIITIYHATKLVKISKQLISDEKANLVPFLEGAFGRAEAAWENDYFLEGSGSGQPLGARDGGTVVTAWAGSAACTAAEVVTHFHALPEPYHGAGCAWSMRMATLGIIRGLTGNPFSFQITPAGSVLPGLDLMGYPVYPSAAMDAIGSATHPILLGNWNFYMIAERQSMTIQRLNELYAGNGQIGLLATFRRGGAPTQAAAFRYALCAT